MAEAVIAAVLQQLTMIFAREVEQEIRLVAGVEKDVRKLTSTFQTIEDVLVDAENRQLEEPPVRRWLDKLKDIAYDVEDVLDVWNTSILKFQIEGVKSTSITKSKVFSLFPCPLVCLQRVALRRDIARKIKDIHDSLDDIVKEKTLFKFNEIRRIPKNDRKERLTTSFIDMSEVRGRDEEINTLVNLLLPKRNIEEEKGLHVISIVGMGGIGKTTLAQLAYNRGEILSCFDKRIWVCVSEHCDQIKIAKAIIEGLTGADSTLNELQSLLEYIRDCIVGKRIFLVLDDVWTEDQNELEPLLLCLKNAAYGSKIVVTTRKVRVAQVMGSGNIIPIKELSDDESWLLFKRIAFSERSMEECENLEEVGWKIIRKCKGLPLAAKTMGSFLRFKITREEWQSILVSEIWKLEFEKSPLPPLLLSYNDLPLEVKRCFLYCASFPKDHEIVRDELIRLWMAQGYLGYDQNNDLEMIGRGYFDILATRSFFQNFEYDDFGNFRICKMHDIVHDFAQFLTKKECSTIEYTCVEKPSMDYSCDNARHLTMILRGGASFCVSNFRVKMLRSLWIDFSRGYNKQFSVILPKLFDQLACLRALRLRGDHLRLISIKEIPKEIGKLKLLRYLDLSDNKDLTELPETLCELYNLQTLDLSWCSLLEKLPRGMRKLINLRHLLNKSTKKLSYVPKGLEELTYLATLSEFVVRDDGNGNHLDKACTLESLRELKNLRHLGLKRLGNIENASEAKKAELEKKKDLISLHLVFSTSKEGQRRRITEDDELLLEYLQPPSSLEILSIDEYRGKTMFPTWMMSLTHLKKLNLRDCNDFKSLPPLGRLPSLESLTIWVMKRVKRVGKEFLGVGNDVVDTSSSSSSSSSSVVAFPKLKRLLLMGMEEWEEWDLGNVRWGGEDVSIMPNLFFLHILDCPKLKALPDLFRRRTTLNLVINTCPFLY